jgi:mono/diheme cytochrome c family protein
MRYFLLFWLLLCIVVVSVMGLRYQDGGSISRKPPLEIFPDMDRQPKLRPQTEFTFFNDKRSSRAPVEGTIPHSKPLQFMGRPVQVDGRDVFAFEDSTVTTGKLPGTTNFVENSPLPITEQLLARGQERFQISCVPCHGPQADGKGITTKYGMAIVANLHDPRIVRQTDGEIFNTISYGKNLMGAYGPNVEVADRWAIVSYLRALQRSRLGTIEDVPPAMQTSLKK